MKVRPAIYSLIAIIAGLCLGCAAPGIGLWCNAWFALAPLLFIVRVDSSLPRSLLYGFLFGLAYNCVYLQWYLGLAPLNWLGFNDWQGQLLAIAALMITSSHQAILIAIFAFIYCLFLKTNKSWLAETENAGLMQMLIVPLLWVIVVSKLGNASEFIGVPWSMLEYTQYKQIYIIQIADLIGGVGISFLIVMVNALWSQIVFGIYDSAQAKLYNSFSGICQKIADQNLPALTVWLLLFLSTTAYGYFQLRFTKSDGSETVSIIQPNINIEMEKTKRKYSLSELLAHQLGLANQCPAGLCVWTEGSLPTVFSQDEETQTLLTNFAKTKKLSFIIGTIDKDNNGNFYNAACAVPASGKLPECIYHKRYLVPFGEYTPFSVRDWPDWILRLTNTPAGGGYTPGNTPALLNINSKLIAPLICFEVISPELTAESVRAGGQLLVNLNDLAWFHESIIGEQMIAAAVMRAVENQRYFIFAANTGPSTVITCDGIINSYLGQNKAAVLTSKINYLSDLSFFTRYFRF